MSYKLVDELYTYINDKTQDLNDDDYVRAFRAISGRLDSAADAKEEELD